MSSFKKALNKLDSKRAKFFGPSLREIFEKHEGRLIYKWDHYLDIYERHFSRLRGQRLVIVEIGVYQGGSLQMWQKYFGKNATIYGVDIDSRCKEFEAPGIHIVMGNQSDRDFLRSLKANIGPIDILIDDGGHHMDQQIITFEELFPAIQPNGIYLCEDLHTSYWPEYSGGYKKPGTFIEYSKNLIDYLNAWHSKEDIFAPNNFTSTAFSMHYYDSVLVIEKKPMMPPKNRKVGTPVFPE